MRASVPVISDFRVLNLNAGTSYHKGDFTPVVQAGVTYAVTKNLHITGGVDLAFPRYETHTADTSYSMRPSPATFKVAVGLAF